ncbi:MULTISPECIES: hypothetical protein [Oscillatoriales]|uniref:hypothetical protein n=1 Tax=Oscillatoriales TaxID=1150 RepID=UPI000A40ABB4|nr:hypothetical protein [Arthrospira platensis NCB002]MDF2207323.1 hypothetical protein [Arthrospira platensis NCB002]QQW32324.1 hypothetical protein AP9108_27405 [Arthrospira sp. PCC 9108]QQW32325.1 hypothetical protein AP9108_27435 [Arthrospira sp. PCC 9108]
MYIDSLGNYLLLLSWLILKHILPPTETSTPGETNDVIAVNGEERTDRLAIDCYHKGVTLSVFGWGDGMGI